MSIEKDLSRIADGVEAILAILKPVTQIAIADGAVVTGDLPAKAGPAKAESEPSEEGLRVAIRDYMKKTDKETAIALLVKYGANKEKPMIKDVTNKVALMKELTNG